MSTLRRLAWLRSRLNSVASLSLFRSNPQPAPHCSSLPSRLSISRFLAMSPTGDSILDHYPKLRYRCIHGIETSQKHLAYTDIGYNHSYNHVRATPLLDLLSVRVMSDECGKDQRAFEIFGYIKLIDVEQNHAYVFSRTRENPQTVSSGCDLLLTNLEGICTYLHVPSAPAFKMCVHLQDAADNEKVIAKGDFDLQLFDHEDGLHEKVITEVVRGPDGNFVSVQYATLPYAVLATVSLTFTKIDAAASDQSEPAYANIYGCISASSKVQHGCNISSVLLNKTRCDPMTVIVGKPIQLTRPMLAVPAYSSLEIRADLWDHHTDQRIANGAILGNFEAEDVDNDEVGDWPIVECELGQNYLVQVEVCWHNAYVPQIVPYQESSSALSYRGSLMAKDELLTSPPKSSVAGSPMVEVFSVTISPDSDANSAFCGIIEVDDNTNIGGRVNPFIMFQHPKGVPVKLTRDKRVKYLKWPASPFEGEYFYMLLILYDDKGHQVCSGYINWKSSSIISSISWYGKLISSVIRGKHGYATVHYAMFPKAVHANVQAVFKSDDSTGYNMYMIIGNISARYSCFTYSSDIEKKFFQSNLLTHNHRLVLCGGSVMEFEKNAVAVPVGSLLILSLNLQVGIVGRRMDGSLFSEHYGSLNNAVDFKFDAAIDETCKSIAGEGFEIEVSVRWKEVDKHEKGKHLRSLESDLYSRYLQV